MNTQMKYLAIFLILFVQFGCSSKKEDFKIELSPASGTMTKAIQQAINSCGSEGGGTVVFTSGKYVSGGLHMRSNVTLDFRKGATLEGSDKLEDYGKWDWANALIMGDSLKNIAIIGDGVLDGIDLKNPKGEAGFRGPHCIRFTHCDSVTIKDITIVRSANWAMNFRHCGYGKVHNVKVRGGHDGLHTRFCNNFDVRDCDFRTGDDAFAGNDNRDFYIENCKINTSCNAFRFGCMNLDAQNCLIWGPGEYKHIKQNRNNTLAAFVHFSPKGEDPKLKSGNWLIKNFTIKNVDQFFNYNYKYGLWQMGQPMSDIVFENLTVTNVKKGLFVEGGGDRGLKLTIRNATFTQSADADFKKLTYGGKKLDVPAFFNLSDFGEIDLEGVTIKTDNKDAALNAHNGKKLVLDDVTYEPENNDSAVVLKNIDNVVKK